MNPWPQDSELPAYSPQREVKTVIFYVSLAYQGTKTEWIWTVLHEAEAGSGFSVDWCIKSESGQQKLVSTYSMKLTILKTYFWIV